MKVKVIFNNENERYKIYNGDTVINANELIINEIPIDSELSAFSANAVENKVVKEAIDANIKDINTFKAKINNDISVFNDKINSIITKGSSTIAGTDFNWDWDDELTGRVGTSSTFKIAPNTVVFIAIPKKCYFQVLLNNATVYEFGDSTATDTQLGVFVTSSNITDSDEFSLFCNVTSDSDYMDIRALVEANTTLLKADYPEELKDIRIDTDGNDWGSAGDAVRGQVNKLNTKLSNLYNTYDYIELEKEEITESDYGYYNPAHPTVGQSLTFQTNTSGEYVNLKYDLSNLIGEEIIVQSKWISWFFTGAIVDSNNKVLAVPPTQTDNTIFRWTVKVPKNAKWLYTNTKWFNLYDLSTDSQKGKYKMREPFYILKKSSTDYGNTEKYKTAVPITMLDNYAINTIAVDGHYTDDKMSVQSAMNSELHLCKTGDKFHIVSRNNYSIPAYMVFDRDMNVLENSIESGNRSFINKIVEIDTDGYIVYQYETALKMHFIRKAYKYTSEKSGISGLKVTCCGDSIMAGDSNANRTSIADLLCNDYDMIPQNLAVGGATMAIVDTRSHICEQVQNIDTDTDIIILEGGVNDFFRNHQLGALVGAGDTTTTLDTATFAGALETALRWIFNNRPHKPILYVLNHHIKDADYGTNPQGNTFQDYRDLILDASKNYGFIPIRVDLTAFNTDFTQASSEEYSTDGTHPTDKGYRKWYLPLIVEAIQKSIG